ncbi:hypothetical protein [Microvirga yunnanensis]|uniref:hypothetical protein n=1 Tax=Microvirga yunnanensis TaxID=2953740 RepID=UPI0021CA6AF7|nr:hypothetical protein [Microvirga sp. HBU67655]
MGDTKADPTERRRVAFHEAGHGIVLWSFNIKVMRLYICDSGDGQVAAGSPTHLPIRDQIAITMAGWAGAEIGGYPHSSLECAELTLDRLAAEDIAIGVLGAKDNDADETAIRSLLVEGREKARMIIETHRARFEAIAERLFLGGVIDADEISSLLPSLEAP